MNHDLARFVSLLSLLMALSVPAIGLAPTAASGGVIEKDSSGFYGISWGTSLADVQTLTLAETWDHVRGYDLKGGPPQLGNAKVEYARFFMIDGKFARVTIRYQGKQTHEQILAYLQSQFGPIDRSPGLATRGFNQQFNWRGSDTEVNVTYHAPRERGYVFIESRALAARFNDGLSATAY